MKQKNKEEDAKFQRRLLVAAIISYLIGVIFINAAVFVTPFNVRPEGSKSFTGDYRYEIGGMRERPTSTVGGVVIVCGSELTRSPLACAIGSREIPDVIAYAETYDHWFGSSQIVTKIANSRGSVLYSKSNEEVAANWRWRSFPSGVTIPIGMAALTVVFFNIARRFSKN